MSAESFQQGEEYLIESLEHKGFGGVYRVWWKPERLGYTIDIEEAGLYSAAEALEICDRAGPENEKAWLAPAVMVGLAGRICKVVRS